MEEKETTTETPRSSNWGGARKGAGRKPKKEETRGRKAGDGRGRLGGGRKSDSAEGAKVQTIFYILPSSRRKVDILRERGLGKMLSSAIDKTIEEMAVSFGVD